MYEFLEYRVEDVMTRQPVVIGRHTTIGEIQNLFARHGFNGVPVVDEGDRLVGLVTKLDVLKAFLFTPQSVVPHYDEVMRSTADRVITWEPFTVEPDLPLTRVLEKMVHTRCKSFPVTAGGRLVGIVSREDVLGALKRAAGGIRPSRRNVA